MTIRERQALSILLSATQLRWTLSSLWALKEGYTKAVGDGVGFGLDRIQVKFGDPPRLPDKASIGPTGQSISPRREQVSHARFSGETEASLPVLGVKMEASLPVLGVKVDGVNVRQAGWDWAIGTVGTAGSWDQVGWAMYWQDREDQDRVRETADVGVGAEGGGQGARPRVEVVEWDDLIRVFDRLPSYKSRSSS
jgi:4'-phosphopantetheinyl transferase